MNSVDTFYEVQVAGSERDGWHFWRRRKANRTFKCWSVREAVDMAKVIARMVQRHDPKNDVLFPRYAGREFAGFRPLAVVSVRRVDCEYTEINGWRSDAKEDR